MVLCFMMKVCLDHMELPLRLVGVHPEIESRTLDVGVLEVRPQVLRLRDSSFRRMEIGGTES